MRSSVRSVPATAADVYPEWAVEARKEHPPVSMDEYFQGWAAFFDHYASKVKDWRRRNAGYHQAVSSLTRFYVPENQRVLEVGSGTGDLLASTRPRRGVGIDISGEMIRLARDSYPDLEFHQMAAERLDLKGEKFDYIILSDLTGFLFDIRLVFERLRTVCHPGTRIVLHSYSRVWQPILLAAERLGLKYPQPVLNWTTVEDVSNLLYLTNFEVVQKRAHILLPKQLPLLTKLANRYVAHLPVFRQLCLTNWIVARPLHVQPAADRPSVSIICPCRNEAGNIQRIVDRLPSLGGHTELIFVEGHSKDDTLETCRRVAAATPQKDITVLVRKAAVKGMQSGSVSHAPRVTF
jgi:ubiquinone/menaquinone biosynthesis C-methylase UbiE